VSAKPTSYSGGGAGSAKVEVAHAALDDASGALLACGLDMPKPGATSAFYGLDVRGWAIGREAPVAEIALAQAPVELRRARVGGERPDVAEHHPDPEWSRTSGFFMPVSALRLEREFDLVIEAQLEDGRSVRIGGISGRRAALDAGFQPELTPIGLTALGRTGSTALVKLLGSHPDVVAYRPFEYEPRVATYWIELLQDLADPASFRRQITPNGPLVERWWAGAEEPFPRRIVDEELQSWIGGESVEELARVCLARIDGFYRQVADRIAARPARHFVEKLGPGAGALLRELVPSAREIFLVRDFRDVLASTFAYNERRGVQGFGRDLVQSDVRYVAERFSKAVGEFALAWEARSRGAHLVRYEELVLAPRETLAAALAYLELDSSPATLDAMLAGLDAAPSDYHRTASTPDSIGRWRDDLPAEVREECERSLALALDEFGYAP
jgi:hypothetical protein